MKPIFLFLLNSNRKNHFVFFSIASFTPLEWLKQVFQYFGGLLQTYAPWFVSLCVTSSVFRGLLFALFLLFLGEVLKHVFQWGFSRGYFTFSKERIEIFYVGTFYSFFVRALLGFFSYSWNSILELFVEYNMEITLFGQNVSLKNFGISYSFDFPFGTYFMVWLGSLVAAFLFFHRMKKGMILFIFESMFLKGRWYKQVYASFANLWYKMFIGFRSFNPFTYSSKVKFGSKMWCSFFFRYMFGGYYIYILPFI